MKDLPRILAAYAAIDALLERDLGSSAVPAQVEARQILNDQAYLDVRAFVEDCFTIQPALHRAL